MNIVISIRVEGTTNELRIDHHTTTQTVVLMRGAMGDNLRMMLVRLVDEFVNNNAPAIIEFVEEESQLEELERKRAELQKKLDHKRSIARNQAKR